MRSKTERTACSPLTMTDTSDSSTPASARSIGDRQPLDERFLGGTLALVGGHGAPHGRQRAALQVGPGREALGGEVGQPVLVPGDPGAGRGDRVEGGVLLDEGVGDRVDGAAGCVGHGADPSAGAERGPAPP